MIVNRCSRLFGPAGRARTAPQTSRRTNVFRDVDHRDSCSWYRVCRGGAAAAGAPGQPDGAAVFKTGLRVLSVSPARRRCRRRTRCARSRRKRSSPPSPTARWPQQGATLSPAEHTRRRAVHHRRAPVAATASGTLDQSLHGRDADDRSGAQPGWMAWGGDDTNNARYVPKGGITAADLAEAEIEVGVRLRRRRRRHACSRQWPAASCSSPATTPSCLALNPKTGCAYWSYKAETGIRSALTVGPYKNGRTQRLRGVLRRHARQRAYAVDADHRSARSGSARSTTIRRRPSPAPSTVDGGKVFVPTQGLNEEGTGGRGGGACCTFRGSLTALDANTGAVLWTDLHGRRAETARQEHARGGDAFGPSGGAIWSAPTVDAKRRSRLRLHRQRLFRSATEDDQRHRRARHRQGHGQVGVSGDAERRVAGRLRRAERWQSGLPRTAGTGLRLLGRTAADERRQPATADHAAEVRHGATHSIRTRGCSSGSTVLDRAAAWAACGAHRLTRRTSTSASATDRRRTPAACAR